MSDFENCGGDCANCGLEDCGQGATITLTLDNDETLECSIIAVFKAAGNEYIALLPLDENGQNDDGEVYIYRYSVSSGMPVLDNIEDDEEYEAAAEGFDEWLDSREYDELVPAEENGSLSGEKN